MREPTKMQESAVSAICSAHDGEPIANFPDPDVDGGWVAVARNGWCWHVNEDGEVYFNGEGGRHDHAVDWSSLEEGEPLTSHPSGEAIVLDDEEEDAVRSTLSEVRRRGYDFSIPQARLYERLWRRLYERRDAENERREAVRKAIEWHVRDDPGERYDVDELHNQPEGS